MQGILSLNHRPRALITHALRHATQRYTIRAHQVSHAIVYQTARTDLLDLEKRGQRGLALDIEVEAQGALQSRHVFDFS